MHLVKFIPNHIRNPRGMFSIFSPVREQFRGEVDFQRFP